MKEIETRSTSSTTAVCKPISLRERERVRLVFLPTLVQNNESPDACVRGTFVYQKRGKNDEWLSMTDLSLTSLKAGEGYQLELRSGELLTLMTELVQLYPLYRQEGIPMGSARFVKLDPSLARFLAQGESELRALFESDTNNAAKILLTLLKWLAVSPEGVSKVSELALSDLPKLTSFLGLASLKGALKYWVANRSNNSEEFWQRTLAERAYVLHQAYAYPIVIIQAKAYVGGKQVSNSGGNVVDFLATVESTNAVLLIEIKTPKTKLLGAEYRNNVYPLSNELSGAIAQALNYQRSLGLEFNNITTGISRKPILGEPRCLIIAGNAKEEFADEAMRVSFELQRERLRGVTVITYDELFRKLGKLIELLEG